MTSDEEMLDAYIKANFGDIAIDQKTRDSVKETFGYHSYFIACKNRELAGMFSYKLQQMDKALNTMRAKAIKRYFRS